MEECSFVYDKEMYGTHTNAVLRARAFSHSTLTDTKNGIR
jgi:hypothetical protein